MMVKAVVGQDISFDRIAALEIMAIWLNKQDVAHRLTFPAVFNEATEVRLESYRPQLRRVIVQTLYMQGKMVITKNDRLNFDVLQRTLAPVSSRAVARIKEWLKHDANSRGVDPKEVRHIFFYHIPTNQLAKPNNELFEDRWDAYQNDGLKNRIGSYFDPRKDAEKLIAKILEQEGNNLNQMLSAIPVNKVRWKRFAEHLSEKLSGGSS